MENAGHWWVIERGYTARYGSPELGVTLQEELSAAGLLDVTEALAAKNVALSTQTHAPDTYVETYVERAFGREVPRKQLLASLQNDHVVQKILHHNNTPNSRALQTLLPRLHSEPDRDVSPHDWSVAVRKITEEGFEENQETVEPDDLFARAMEMERIEAEKEAEKARSGNEVKASDRPLPVSPAFLSSSRGRSFDGGAAAAAEDAELIELVRDIEAQVDSARDGLSHIAGQRSTESARTVVNELSSLRDSHEASQQRLHQKTLECERLQEAHSQLEGRLTQAKQATENLEREVDTLQDGLRGRKFENETAQRQMESLKTETQEAKEREAALKVHARMAEERCNEVTNETETLKQELKQRERELDAECHLKTAEALHHNALTHIQQTETYVRAELSESLLHLLSVLCRGGQQRTRLAETLHNTQRSLDETKEEKVQLERRNEEDHYTKREMEQEAQQREARHEQEKQEIQRQAEVEQQKLERKLQAEHAAHAAEVALENETEVAGLKSALHSAEVDLEKAADESRRELQLAKEEGAAQLKQVEREHAEQQKQHQADLQTGASKTIDEVQRSAEERIAEAEATARQTEAESRQQAEEAKAEADRVIKETRQEMDNLLATLEHKDKLADVQDEQRRQEEEQRAEDAVAQLQQKEAEWQEDIAAKEEEFSKTLAEERAQAKEETRQMAEENASLRSAVRALKGEKEDVVTQLLEGETRLREELRNSQDQAREEQERSRQLQQDLHTEANKSQQRERSAAQMRQHLEDTKREEETRLKDLSKKVERMQADTRAAEQSHANERARIERDCERWRKAAEANENSDNERGLMITQIRELEKQLAGSIDRKVLVDRDAEIAHLSGLIDKQNVELSLLRQQLRDVHGSAHLQRSRQDIQRQQEHDRDVLERQEVRARMYLERYWRRIETPFGAEGSLQIKVKGPSKLDPEPAVVISEVVKGGVASRAGLLPGHLIIRVRNPVGTWPIFTRGDFLHAIGPRGHAFVGVELSLFVVEDEKFIAEWRKKLFEHVKAEDRMKTTGSWYGKMKTKTTQYAPSISPPTPTHNIFPFYQPFPPPSLTGQ